MSRRRLYSFAIDADLQEGLRALKQVYGVAESVQVRLALRLWLDLAPEQKAALLGPSLTGKERRMTRARMIEDTSGVGTLRLEDGSQSWPTKYRLVVEVDQVKAGDQWLDGLQEIEATIDLKDDGVKWRAVMDQWPLVLELNDGRIFECWMADGRRLTSRTGHALRRPN